MTPLSPALQERGKDGGRLLFHVKQMKKNINIT